MKAVIIEKFGPPDVLKIKDVDQPVYKTDELLVRVKAVSINPLDYKMRNGSISPLGKLMLPRIIGSDFAGIVKDVGGKVKGFKPGDRVFGSLSPFKSGACAEYITVKASQAAEIPQQVPFEEAAAIPIAGLTALQALRDLGKVTEGSKVLINGAAGGVGSFAVQLAKIMQAQVTAVCSTNKVSFVQKLGADRVVDYKKEDYRNIEDKYDFFFDVVSNASLNDAFSVLTDTGIYTATLPSAQKVWKSFLSAGRVKIIMVKKKVADLDFLVTLTAKKDLKVIISNIYTLEEIQQAHTEIESGHVRGKLVVSL